MTAYYGYQMTMQLKVSFLEIVNLKNRKTKRLHKKSLRCFNILDKLDNLPRNYFDPTEGVLKNVTNDWKR